MAVQPVTRFRGVPDLVNRGWGTMRRDGSRWLFVPQSDQMVTVAGVTGKVHRRVAPLVEHLRDWLVAHRRRPLDREGNWGLSVRPIRGREAAAYAGTIGAWSNHSAGLAVDWEAPRNPLGATGRGDFPPGWAEECHACGFAWGAADEVGGDYTTRPDRMHIEFVGTPAQADLHVARLRGAARPAPAPAPLPAPIREDDPMVIIPIRPDDKGAFHEAAMIEVGSEFGGRGAVTLGCTWGTAVVTITALDHANNVLQRWDNVPFGVNGFWAHELAKGARIVTVEGTVDTSARLAAALHTKAA